MLTHTEIILAWPAGEDGKYGVLSDDVGKSPSQIALWKHRGRIPPEVWPDIICAAEARGIGGVTLEALAAGARKEGAAA